MPAIEGMQRTHKEIQAAMQKDKKFTERMRSSLIAF